MENFLATYRVRRHADGKPRMVELPLFPGYVFARFDYNDRLPVLTAPGIVNIVSFCGVPAPVDEQELAAVQAIVSSKVGAQPYPFLSQGRRVAIDHGPLRGLEGFVVQVKNQFRIVASVTMLQRSVSIEVEREWIRPVGSAPRALAAAL